MHTPTPLLRSIALASLCALGLGNAAADQPAYYYWGLSAGQARSHIDEGSLASAASNGGPVSNLNSNENDTAYKLFGGYQFNRNVGVEMGYFDLGHTSYTATGLSGAFESDTHVRGFNIDVVGTLPLSDTFSVLGRVGAAAARTHATFSGPSAMGLTDSARNQTNAKMGLGLQWEMSQSVWLRGEVERYRINSAMGSRHNVDAYTVSIVMPLDRKSSGQTGPGYSANPR